MRQVTNRTRYVNVFAAAFLGVLVVCPVIAQEKKDVPVEKAEGVIIRNADDAADISAYQDDLEQRINDLTNELERQVEEAKARGEKLEVNKELLEQAFNAARGALDSARSSLANIRVVHLDDADGKGIEISMLDDSNPDMKVKKRVVMRVNQGEGKEMEWASNDGEQEVRLIDVTEIVKDMDAETVMDVAELDGERKIVFMQKAGSGEEMDNTFFSIDGKAIDIDENTTVNDDGTRRLEIRKTIRSGDNGQEMTWTTEGEPRQVTVESTEPGGKRTVMFIQGSGEDLEVKGMVIGGDWSEDEDIIEMDKEVTENEDGTHTVQVRKLVREHSDAPSNSEVMIIKQSCVDSDEIANDLQNDQKTRRMKITVDKNTTKEGNAQVRRKSPRVIIISMTENGEVDTDSETIAAEARSNTSSQVLEKDVLTTPGTRIVAAGYSLSDATPNPSTNEATIAFTIPETVPVSLSLFNETGELIQVLVDKDLSAGEHAVKFDVNDLPTGLYLYRIEAGGYSQTKTMNVIK